MEPTRAGATRFLLGFVVVLALLPALVWGIQAGTQDRAAPTRPNEPAAAENDPGEPGCRALMAPESLAERAAACETEPPAWSPPEPQREPRVEPRRAKPKRSARAETERPTDTGEAETVDAPEPPEATDEPKDAVELVGAFLDPVPEVPTLPLDDVEEALDDARALLPDPAETRPEIEIHLQPAPIVSIPAPDTLPTTDAVPTPEPVPAVEPPVEVPLTALLVLDERTAEQLGMPSRMTLALGEAAERALAILRERAGLEVTIAAPGSSEPPRD